MKANEKLADAIYEKLFSDVAYIAKRPGQQPEADMLTKIMRHIYTEKIMEVLDEYLPPHRTIQFTWGGSQSQSYTVSIKFNLPGITPIYEPIIFPLKSCHDAQQTTFRLNKMLQRWMPDLLAEGAELPERNHCLYPKPEEKPEPSPVVEALHLAVRYGGIDGAHHKTWVIDQMVRILAGNNYDAIVTAAKAGEDGPDTYGWDEGIAP